MTGGPGRGPVIEETAQKCESELPPPPSGCMVLVAMLGPCAQQQRNATA